MIQLTDDDDDPCRDGCPLQRGHSGPCTHSSTTHLLPERADHYACGLHYQSGGPFISPAKSSPRWHWEHELTCPACIWSLKVYPVRSCCCLERVGGLVADETECGRLLIEWEPDCLYSSYAPEGEACKRLEMKLTHWVRSFPEGKAAEVRGFYCGAPFDLSRCNSTSYRSQVTCADCLEAAEKAGR